MYADADWLSSSVSQKVSRGQWNSRPGHRSDCSTASAASVEAHSETTVSFASLAFVGLG